VGSSLPPTASIDLVGSFARVHDTDIEIVLAEPELLHGEDGVTLWLSKGHRRVATRTRVVRQDHGTRQVVARAPRTDLTKGLWSLTLETAGADPAKQVDARLLVQGERPIVLLWGATGQKSMLPVRHARRPPSRRVSAVAAGRVALDRVLRLLPPERAASVRTRARSVARRVMP
jgi:hypothetical protein